MAKSHADQLTRRFSSHRALADRPCTVERRVPRAPLLCLTTIHGRFERYQRTLDLSHEPAVQLTLDAASLDTKHPKRYKHLRSPDFFDIEHHPQVRFLSDSVKLDGETLTIRGQLEAAGKQVPIELEANVRPVDDELEIEAATQVDHRKLGMMWSPLGILRAPSTFTVRGRLVRAQPTP